jgi:hypothetical protein
VHNCWMIVDPGPVISWRRNAGMALLEGALLPTSIP